VYSLAKAAEMSGITEELLALWVKTGIITPTVDHTMLHINILGKTRPPELHRKKFMFDDTAIESIRQHVESSTRSKRTTTRATPEIVQDFYSVAEVAAMWNLSTDSIRRLFREESDVMVLGSGVKSGRRTTLRIPPEAVERVKRRLARK